jgi:hypothetical protein
MEMLRATSGRSMSLSMLGGIAVQDVPTIVSDGDKTVAHWK